MNMKEVMDRATIRAVKFNSDTTTKHFYAGLRQGVLRSTRCEPCALTVYPPRGFCARCGGEEVRWVDLPQRGTLYAFSQQHRSLRFFAPDVLGLVEFEGVDGLVFGKIAGSFEGMEIGQLVETGVVEVSPKLVLIEFRPAEASGDAPPG